MTLGEQFPTVLIAAGTGAEWAWTDIYRDLAPSVLDIDEGAQNDGNVAEGSGSQGGEGDQQNGDG
jgi:hypothetical protein